MLVIVTQSAPLPTLIVFLIYALCRRTTCPVPKMQTVLEIAATLFVNIGLVPILNALPARRGTRVLFQKTVTASRDILVIPIMAGNAVLLACRGTRVIVPQIAPVTIPIAVMVIAVVHRRW